MALQLTTLQCCGAAATVMALQRSGAVTLWCCSAPVLWCCDAMALRRYSVVALQRYGIAALQCCGAVAHDVAMLQRCDIAIRDNRYRQHTMQ